MHQAFLSYSVEKLRQYDERIAICLKKLSHEQIWWRGAEEQNALGNIVLHLCGNMTEWILQGLADEAPSRNRDAEFAARGGTSREELIARLHSTVERAITVIQSLSAERLEEEVTVQKYRLPVSQVVYHVVEHFSQHTGQILFATKLTISEDLGFYGYLNQVHQSETAP